MTHVIHARNVNVALESGLHWLLVAGIKENSRNGKVLVAPGPVITEYERPTERVLFSPLRDANPFFHLFESFWMLGGRNDVAFVNRYAAQIAAYSDDGQKFHSAYGHRWKHHFEFNQLERVISELGADSNSRRVVLAMWDAYSDFQDEQGGKKDLPCNTHAYFDLRGGVLNMTVSNRSNDVVWGAYGANAVHFSVLQEYLAARLGAPVGIYRQFSNNYHAYIERPDTMRLIDLDNGVKYESKDHYAIWSPSDQVVATPMVTPRNVGGFMHDIGLFLQDPSGAWQSYDTIFFRNTVWQMSAAHDEYKAGNAEGAFERAQGIAAWEWREACIMWLTNRPSMNKDKPELLGSR